MFGRNTLIRTVLMSSLLLLGAQVQADLILTPATLTIENGDSAGCQADAACAGNPGTAAILTYLTGAIADFGAELYKSDVVNGAAGVGSDSGPFAADYNTTFSNSDDDPANALIEWLGGSFMDDARYLLVKDGNHAPIWYLFDIKSWDGMEDISITGFWPEKGAISHVAIYGGDSKKIPEPGTLALLGLGLVGMGLTRRRRKV